MLFNDLYNANKIFTCTEPVLMKSYGKKVQGFKEDKWVEVREDIVYKGCYAKFSQNEDLKFKLLSFDKDEVFVECSPFDKIWGIGLLASDSRSDDIASWKGLNLLGKCLSRVRKDLCT